MLFFFFLPERRCCCYGNSGGYCLGESLTDCPFTIHSAPRDQVLTFSTSLDKTAETVKPCSCKMCFSVFFFSFATLTSANLSALTETPRSSCPALKIRGQLSQGYLVLRQILEMFRTDLPAGRRGAGECREPLIRLSVQKYHFEMYHWEAWRFGLFV